MKQVMSKVLNANEMFKKVFDGRRLTNTRIIKRGKINKDMSFEIAENINRDGAFLTVVTLKNNDILRDLEINNIYDNKELAKDALDLFKISDQYKNYMKELNNE